MIIDSNIILILFIIITIMYLTNSLESFTISRPTKCFDCERQFIKNYGLWSVWQTMPSKCFDCEHQFKKKKINPYFSGPTKCFDCDNRKNLIKKCK